MTREEKAHSLSQMYFPDDQNIWARPNYEAKWVADACIQMAEWEHKRLVEKACDWLKSNLGNPKEVHPVLVNHLIENFRKAMEE